MAKRRVRYVGRLVPSLAGRFGVLVWVDRDGWFRVRFDGDAFTSKCAQINIAFV